MVWILLATASLLVVALAARASRFRRIAEPVLSVLVAAGLLGAFVIWWTDDNAGPQEPVSPVLSGRPVAELDPVMIRLEDLVFTQGTPPNSFTVVGTIHNDGAAFLDYFTLDVTLQDCPADDCSIVGSDDALVIARVPPGRSAPLRTSLVFPDRRVGPPVAPRFTTGVAGIHALPASR